MDINESTGIRVRNKRIKKGWTQEELSKRSGLSTGHISDIENGIRVNLQSKTLKKLAKGLGTSITDLLGDGK